MTRHPFCRDSSTRRVIGGFGITSATIISAVIESIANAAQTLGRRTMEPGALKVRFRAEPTEET